MLTSFLNNSFFLQLRLVDPVKLNRGKWKSAVLTIWKPSEDIRTYLTEGAVVTFYNVFASGCRYHQHFNFKKLYFIVVLILKFISFCICKDLENVTRFTY